MSIIFVTGVSAAGKSTLYEGLRNDPELADVEFHDIDEDGIPPAGTGAWRQFRVELLLHEAVVRGREEGRSTVVFGVSKPHEVIESGAFPEDLDVYFVLVDVSTPVLRKRLEARLAGRPADDIEFSVQWNRLLGPTLRKSVQQQRNGIIVEASRLSRARVRGQVKQLIQDLCV